MIHLQSTESLSEKQLPDPDGNKLRQYKIQTHLIMSPM